MRTASTVADYIDHNRSLGKRFVGEAAILSAFSRAVGSLPLRNIRSGVISRFVHREGTSAETIAKKHRVLTSFFRYAVTRGRLKTSPMPSLERKRGATSFTPYIFSEAELKRLIASVPAATGPHSDIDADTLRTFVLLLYGAGLRRGEARRLKVEDVDLPRSLLHIRGTKFFKTRIVPVSASLGAVLNAFVARRSVHVSSVSSEGGSLLFCKKDGTLLTNSAVGAAFRRLRTIAGIKRDGGARNQPRLHDLRHSAAVHRVTSWYRSGADLNDLLPKLATYLGHKDLSGTQRYLTMTEELLAEAGRRFETFAQGGRYD
jgi:site-specific recombinase XerD